MCLSNQINQNSSYFWWDMDYIDHIFGNILKHTKAHTQTLHVWAYIQIHKPLVNTQSLPVMFLWAGDHRNCLSLWIRVTNQKQAVSSWTCARSRCFLIPHWDVYVPRHDLPLSSSTSLLLPGPRSKSKKGHSVMFCYPSETTNMLWGNRTQGTVPYSRQMFPFVLVYLSHP